MNPEPVAEAMHCHSAGINALASFKDGRWLVSGSDDFTMSAHTGCFAMPFARFDGYVSKTLMELLTSGHYTVDGLVRVRHNFGKATSSSTTVRDNGD